MDNINNIVNSFKDLPAMPNVIMRALNIIKDPESGAKQLADIISYDQSLSTKVLTLVNSAYYGFSQQITSISRGISLIGMSKAKNIIVTVAMRPMLTSQGDKELWQHSIVTAVGCEYLAGYLKIMDVDDAFVIGFLHDLGRLVLRLKDSVTYAKVKQTALDNPKASIIEIERAYFGTDHCQTGSMLAKKWQLPLLINNAIKYHHAPNLSPIPIPCSLVYLVDMLVKPEFDESSVNKEFTKVLNFSLDKPEILRENIFAKAKLLLNELSN